MKKHIPALQTSLLIFIIAFVMGGLSAQPGGNDTKFNGTTEWTPVDPGPGSEAGQMTTDPGFISAGNPGNDEAEETALQDPQPQAVWDRSPVPGFKIYSFRHFLFIKTSQKNIPEGDITMYDLVGNEVFTAKLTDKPLSKYQPGLKEGCYLVKVITGTGVQTQKVFFDK